MLVGFRVNGDYLLLDGHLPEEGLKQWRRGQRREGTGRAEFDAPMTHLATVFKSLVLERRKIAQPEDEGHEQNTKEARAHRGEEAAHQAGRYS